jgi:hypothetical protein
MNPRSTGFHPRLPESTPFVETNLETIGWGRKGRIGGANFG